jgi:hypothetical protein
MIVLASSVKIFMAGWKGNDYLVALYLSKSSFQLEKALFLEITLTIYLSDWRV